jgi:lauroyl/myristoyl acyltransferase
LYTLDRRHRQIAYANLKRAVDPGMTPRERMRLVRAFYRNFGQSIVEIFLIPRIDEKYLKKYVTLENAGYIGEAFARGKGVIFTGMHEGSWELYNIITSNLGFPFHFLVRDQAGGKFDRVVKLLNRYRSEKGCRLIVRRTAASGRPPRGDEREWSGIRELIAVLKRNEAVGMSVDQGGRTGIRVPFFGKDASMASGAVRLAMKYQAVILPAFFVRVRGPYVRIILDAPFEPEAAADEEAGLRSNLARLVRGYEKHIREYPAEYLWTYKTWKYSTSRSVLILSDGKAGHLRQSQSVAGEASAIYRQRGFRAEIAIVEVRFKNALCRRAFACASVLSGTYACQGCLLCLEVCCRTETYRDVISRQPDVIISSGSALAGLNYCLARENLARSIVCMRPSVGPAARFDMVIVPAHDAARAGKKTVVTDGALHVVDGDYLEEHKRLLVERCAGRIAPEALYLGFLIGGPAKGYRMRAGELGAVLDGCLEAAGRLGARLLVTTSRRTPPDVETYLKQRLGTHPACALLVIANEANIPEAVGGILGLSSCVVTTPDSISMMSEASASAAYVVVTDPRAVSAKHRRFIARFSRKGYIRTAPDNRRIGSLIEQLLRERPVKNMPMDRARVREALEKIL